MVILDRLNTAFLVVHYDGTMLRVMVVEARWALLEDHFSGWLHNNELFSTGTVILDGVTPLLWIRRQYLQLKTHYTTLPRSSSASRPGTYLCLWRDSGA
jgi:hypothetical protein